MFVTVKFFFCLGVCVCVEQMISCDEEFEEKQLFRSDFFLSKSQ